MSNKSKWFVYGLVPLGLSLTLQAMYFSGNLTLQRLVCPKLPPLPLDAYREFGLLEMLQNLLLVGMVVTMVVGAVRNTQPRVRLLFAALALFSTFILLEEIDYGTHFYTYASTDEVSGWFTPAGDPVFQTLLRKTDYQAVPFNVHNQGDLTDVIKTVVSVLILGLFVVAPFCEKRVRNPWLRYLIPDRFVVLTVTVMVLTRFLTRYLAGWESDLFEAAQSSGERLNREVGAMNNNLSEFRELLTYYLFLVYVGAIVFLRKAPGVAKSAKFDQATS